MRGWQGMEIRGIALTRLVSPAQVGPAPRHLAMGGRHQGGLWGNPAHQRWGPVGPEPLWRVPDEGMGALIYQMGPEECGRHLFPCCAPFRDGVLLKGCLQLGPPRCPPVVLCWGVEARYPQTELWPHGCGCRNGPAQQRWGPRGPEPSWGVQERALHLSPVLCHGARVCGARV